MIGTSMKIAFLQAFGSSDVINLTPHQQVLFDYLMDGQAGEDAEEEYAEDDQGRLINLMKKFIDKADELGLGDADLLKVYSAVVEHQTKTELQTG